MKRDSESSRLTERTPRFRINSPTSCFAPTHAVPVVLTQIHTVTRSPSDQMYPMLSIKTKATFALALLAFIVFANVTGGAFAARLAPSLVA